MEVGRHAKKRKQGGKAIYCQSGHIGTWEDEWKSGTLISYIQEVLVLVV